MLINVCGGKIHLARVTQCELNYHGSITIDQDLLEAAGLFPNQFVNIWNKTNGDRISTYIFPGERGSKVICLNGGAARHFQLGDEVIIAAEVWITKEELKDFNVKICICDEKNNIIDKLTYCIRENKLLANGFGMDIVSNSKTLTSSQDFENFGGKVQ